MRGRVARDSADDWSGRTSRRSRDPTVERLLSIARWDHRHLEISNSRKRNNILKRLFRHVVVDFRAFRLFFLFLSRLLGPFRPAVSPIDEGDPLSPPGTSSARLWTGDLQETGVRAHVKVIENKRSCTHDASAAAGSRIRLLLFLQRGSSRRVQARCLLFNVSSAALRPTIDF